MHFTDKEYMYNFAIGVLDCGISASCAFCFTLVSFDVCLPTRTF